MPHAGEIHTDGGTLSLPYVGGNINGSIALSATISTPIPSSATAVRPYVVVNGDQTLPDGTVLCSMVLSTPTVNVLSLLGGTDSGNITQPNLQLNPKFPNGATLTLSFNGATAASMSFAST